MKPINAKYKYTCPVCNKTHSENINGDYFGGNIYLKLCDDDNAKLNESFIAVVEISNRPDLKNKNLNNIIRTGRFIHIKQLTLDRIMYQLYQTPKDKLIPSVIFITRLKFTQIKNESDKRIKARSNAAKKGAKLSATTKKERIRLGKLKLENDLKIKADLLAKERYLNPIKHKKPVYL